MTPPLDAKGLEEIRGWLTFPGQRARQAVKRDIGALIAALEEALKMIHWWQSEHGCCADEPRTTALLARFPEKEG